jgi:glutamine cyclotransferase
LTVGVQSFRLMESAFEVVSLLSEATLTLHQESLVPQTYACPGGGSVTLSAQDLDGNRTLNTGDRVNISYAACDGSTSGTLEIAIASVVYDAGQIAELYGAVTINLNFPNQNQATLTGFAETTAHRISASELFWQAGFTETLSIGGRAESGRINVEKTLTVPGGRYTVWIGNTVDSASLGGRYFFTMSSPSPYAGDEHQWPESGQVVGQGFNSSAVYRTHDVAQGIAFYGLDSDSDSDRDWDDLQAQVDWSGLANGVMFGIPGDRNIAPIPTQGINLLGRRIALGAPGEGLVADRLRDRIYVTVPDRHELLVISARTLEVEQRVDLGSRPGGLSLSADGAEIFVGLETAGSIAVIDADTFAVSSVFVATEPGNSGVYKIVETAPGVLYAAVGIPDVDDRIVRIDRASGAVTPVRSIGPVSGEVELLADRGRGLLVAAGGSGDSVPTLRRFDAKDSQSTLLLGKQNRSVDVTHPLSLDPAGTRLYLGSGQVFAMSDFSEVGRIARGTPWASENGTDVLVGTGEGVLHVHSAADLHEINHYVTDCALTRESGEPVTDVDRLIPSPVDGQWLLLGGDILCAVDLNDPTRRPGTG